jgi:hypothetical protein
MVAFLMQTLVYPLAAGELSTRDELLVEFRFAMADLRRGKLRTVTGTAPVDPSKGPPMPSSSGDRHLSPNHRDTLERIFAHPTSHNIEWRAVRSLLEQAGQVEERHDGKLVVSLGAETEVLEPPRGKDVDIQQVVDLRRMLSNAGYRPDGEHKSG